MAGHNKIRMDDLAKLYADLGFEAPKTYIQSGNVTFGSPAGMTEETITKKIEHGLSERFGYDISAMIRSTAEMKKILDVNPFLPEATSDPSRMAVVFLHEEANEEQLGKAEEINYPPDKFKIIGREIYIWCPNGFGKTKLYTNFFEKKLKVCGTARNWNTVNQLYEATVK